MSVATQLKRLRVDGSASVAQSLAPSLLGDAANAARLPRSEVAGTALNGLDALAVGDASLLGLAEPLLLHKPRTDRATLPPDESKRLSDAVVTTALRISPVFVLRPTQKLLEWIVRALEVGRLGEDREVDSLLFAALPFHATSQFPLLVRAVLVPGRQRKLWSWLSPIVKQRKPSSVDFILSEAPHVVLVRLVRFAADSATAGVLNCALSTLVANVVARFITQDSPKSTSVVERRALLLEVLAALSEMRKNLEANNTVRGIGHSGDEADGVLEKSTEQRVAAARPIVEMCSSFLVVVTAGIVTLGAQERNICEVAMKAALAVLALDDSSPALQQPAIGCFIASAVAGNFKSLPDDVYEALSDSRHLLKAVTPLEIKNTEIGQNYIELVYRAYANSSLKRAVECGSDEHAHDDLRDLFASFNTCVSGALVRDIVLGMLLKYLQDYDVTASRPRKTRNLDRNGEKVGRAELQTCSTDDSREESDRIAALICGTLAPLSRGRYATYVDEALRKYFAKRNTLSENSAVMREVVDNALSMALKNTSFGLVKASLRNKDGAGELHVGTLCSSLDHPELTVRRAAVDIVSRLHSNGKFKSDNLKEVGNAMLRRIDLEDEITLVSSAVNCPVLLEICNASDLLTCAENTLSRNLADDRRTKNISKDFRRLIVSLLELCSRCLSGSHLCPSQKNHVLALLIMLSSQRKLPLELSKVRKATLSLLPLLGGIANDLKRCLETQNDDVKRHKLVPERQSLSSSLMCIRWSDDVMTVLRCLCALDMASGLKLFVDRFRSGEENDKKCILLSWTCAMDFAEGGLISLDTRRAWYDFVLLCLRGLNACTDVGVEILDDLSRAWNLGLTISNSDVVEELLRAVSRTGNGLSSVVSFLENRVWSHSSSHDSSSHALEVLGGLAATDKTSFTALMTNVIAAGYDPEAGKRRAALNTLKSFSSILKKKSQSPDGKSDLLMKQDLVSLVIHALKENSGHENVREWNGIDILDNIMQLASASFEKLPPSLFFFSVDTSVKPEIVDLLDQCLHKTCATRPWRVEAAIARSVRVSDPVSRMRLGRNEDIFTAQGLLSRYEREYDAEMDLGNGSATRDVAAEALVLALSRFLYGMNFNVDHLVMEEFASSLKRMLIRTAPTAKDEGTVTLTALGEDDVAGAGNTKQNTVYVPMPLQKMLLCSLAHLSVLSGSLENCDSRHSNDCDMDVKSNRSDFATIRIDVMRYLLQTASISSSLGSLASSILLHVRDLLDIDECANMLAGLATKFSVIFGHKKRPRYENKRETYINSSVSEGVALLELLNRYDNGYLNSANAFPSNFIHLLAGPLWNLVSSIVDLKSTENRAISNDLDYVFQLALEALAIVVDSDSTACKQNGGESLLTVSESNISVALRAVSYQCSDNSRSGTSIHIKTRKSALRLVEVLATHPTTPLNNDVICILEMLGHAQNLQDSISTLQSILPALVEKGLLPSEFIPRLTAACFSPELISDRGNAGSEDFVAHVVRVCSDRVAALQLAIRTLTELDRDEAFDKSIVEPFSDHSHVSSERKQYSVFARTCSRLVAKCELEVADQVLAMTAIDGDRILELVAAHLTSPEFLMAVEEHEANPPVIPGHQTSAESFILLFDSVIGANGNSDLLEKALGAFFGVTPITILAKCIRHSLIAHGGNHTIEALKALAHGLEVSDFSRTGDPTAGDSEYFVFVQEVVDVIFLIVHSRDLQQESIHRDLTFPYDLKVTAVATLEKLARSFGYYNTNAMRICAERLRDCLERECSMMTNGSSSEFNQEAMTFVSSVILCLSSLTELLDVRIADIVPCLASTSLDIIEAALGQSTSARDHPTVETKNADYQEMVLADVNGASFENDRRKREDLVTLLVEAGVCGILAILTHLPKFLGLSPMRRIATLAVKVRSDRLKDLLQQAVARTKPSISIPALSSALDICEEEMESSYGTLLVANVLTGMARTMHRSDVKKQFMDLFSLCLRVLNRRTLLLAHSWSSDIVAATSGQILHDVEKASAAAFVALSLRLPETEFKTLFNKLLEWMESPSVSSDVSTHLSSRSEEVPLGILRLIPTLVVVQNLFEALRGLATPCFVLILDKVLVVVKQQRLDAENIRARQNLLIGKKRVCKELVKISAQSHSERVARNIADLQPLLIANGISCLVQFLRHCSDEFAMSYTVLSNILGSLLGAFDNASVRLDFDLVGDAFCALASRTTIISAKSESREDSRQLLCNISRGILSRARDSASSTRFHACEIARRLAVSTGDEYLVALPEAMPVLADLVDDEDETVEKEARRFVKTLETLSGEAIFEQLKS